MAYLKSAVLARMMGLQPQTLRKWRWQGKGPAFVRDGGRVLYSAKVVADWLEEQKAGKENG